MHNYPACSISMLRSLQSLVLDSDPWRNILSSIQHQPWKTISRRKVLEHSRYLSVESHDILLPSGETIEDWPWVIIPDAAIVLVKTNQGKYLCFRQTKYAIEGTSLAPVAGMLEPGEDALQTAKRELLEEAGYVSADWLKLGSYVVDPNRGVGTVNLFLARDAKHIAKPESDDLEDQELILLSRQELEEALLGGQFKILSWVACIALALQVDS
jgi:ADP-ribose pyrophosphatase